MKPSEYMNVINEIELRFNVADWEIAGIKVWPYLRINIATNLQMERKHPSVPSKFKMFYRLMLVSYEQKKYELSFKSQNKQGKNAEVLFLSHSVFRTKVDSIWYDRFCDPIREELNKESISNYQFEYVPRRQFRGNKTFPSRYIQSKIDFIKFKYEFKKISSDEAFRREYSLLEHFLEEKSIEYSLIPYERLLKDVMIIRELSMNFMEWLEKLGTKIGIAIYYYGIEGFAFNLACKKLGIESIDIQHGVQGEFHRAYGRWENIPEDGYELLPSTFWTWDEAEKDCINNWSEKTSYHKVFNGGNPWLEIWKNPNHPITEYYSNKVKNFINSDEKKINILVTLQKERQIPKLLLETINKSSREWKWFIRLHPAMMGQYEEILSTFKQYNGKIEIEQATKLPLYSLLGHMNIHVTEWSSTVIEADAFDIPSVIIHPFGRELFQNYIQNGGSEYIDTSKQFVEVINRLSCMTRIESEYIDEVNKGIAWIKEEIKSLKSDVRSKKGEVTYL
ncbi:hypothetical protein ACNRWW_18930 [Metabacillus sp. HB246100]